MAQLKHDLVTPRALEIHQLFSILKSSGLVGGTPKHGAPPNFPFKRKGKERRGRREMWKGDVEGEMCRERCGERDVERQMWRVREEEGVCHRPGERTDHSLGCLANFSFTVWRLAASSYFQT